MYYLIRSKLFWNRNDKHSSYFIVAELQLKKTFNHNDFFVIKTTNKLMYSQTSIIEPRTVILYR